MTMLRALQSLDLHACQRMNHASSHDLVRWFFAAVSRLGDGVIWYALMLALPFAFGLEGLETSLRMAVAGIFGLWVYKAIKGRTTRLRPFMVHPTILARVRPLDMYSFPSGHTLQAVSFTTVACVHLPALAWALVPFTVLVGLSRPVLGLHFPSDVVVGAAFGWIIAMLVLAIPL